jgi:glyoxylase-like metal-dependent hydrolase (beta-lactamase superfamily II)
MKHSLARFPVALVAAFTFCLFTSNLTAVAQPFQTSATQYEVYAVRFATIPFSVSGLVAGADKSRTLDIAMMVWVIRGGGRIVLVDSGFVNEKFMQRWKPANYVTPAAALQQGLGIAPEAVTDIVISHSHWDHADGVTLFPRAKVWIQQEEYRHYVSDQGAPLSGADPVVVDTYYKLEVAKRLMLVDGDNREILPGIRVYTGGKHTFASQYVGASTRAGTVVLASDNVYLFENLEKGIAIAQTLDRKANVAAQQRMLSLVFSPKLVIPGHDPAVFARFPTVKPGVVRID